MTDATTYPAALPHEPIEELFPDIFLVHGSARIAPGMRMNRNMLILRNGNELSLINPVRLFPAEEARLQKLKHVIRLGYYHGVDDRYYVDSYGAEFWCQASSAYYPEPRGPAACLMTMLCGRSPLGLGQ